MKRIRVILLFLLLGAVVNIAVAWGLAFRSHDLKSESVSEGFTRRGEDFSYWWVTRQDKPGIVVIDSRWHSSDMYISHTRLPPERSAESVVSVWKEQMLPASIDDIWSAERYLLVSGWPCLTLWSMRGSNSVVLFLETDESVWWIQKNQIEVQLGYDIQSWIFQTRDDSSPYGMLPYAPMWTGFTLNILFYTTILWLLFPGTFALRRIIRRKRGLCVKCAYDLRGTDHEACPECGISIVKANPS